jgi:putative Holliday junction resolvase
MALLGLDVGDKRIGIAMSEGRLAVPSDVIERTTEEEDLERIADLVRNFDAERVVIGLPRSMDGSIGTQAESVLAFSKALANHICIPIEMCDERLTTVTADRLMQESGAKRKKRKKKIDAMAAAVILQAYLDGIRE